MKGLLYRCEVRWGWLAVFFFLSSLSFFFFGGGGFGVEGVGTELAADPEKRVK